MKARQHKLTTITTSKGAPCRARHKTTLTNHRSCPIRNQDQSGSMRKLYCRSISHIASLANTISATAASSTSPPLTAASTTPPPPHSASCPCRSHTRTTTYPRKTTSALKRSRAFHRCSPTCPRLGRRGSSYDCRQIRSRRSKAASTT